MIKRMQQLIEIINQASEAYYKHDNPVMSDKQYDKLWDELERLEKKTGIIMCNSPIHKVQGYIIDGLKKVEHTTPMLSAAKTKDLNEIRKFINNRSTINSFKLDGITLVVRYSNGSYKQAITRGSGYIGEDVTEQAKMIINLPLVIPYDGDLELRGECVISWDNFNKANETLDEPYSHPRNLAAGSIRQLDTNITKQRNLEYVVFELVKGKDFEYKNQALNWIDSLGFTTVDRIILPSPGCEDSPCFYESLVAESLDEVEKYLCAERSKYPVDGQIYEYDNVEYANSLGSTSHHPLKMMARKWADSTYETVLRDIEWNTTRTGTISAVAIFDEVDLDGALTSRATLHNISYIEDLKLGIGDVITVYRSNMVIPAIDENLTKSNTLEIPKTCGCCGASTEIRQDGKAKFLYCTNENCESRLLAKLIHFASRDSMNIDGLSEATLQTFVKKGWVKDITDIYSSLHFQKEEISKISGFGKKSVNNLMNAIEASRKTTMAAFLRALGIPLIGKTQTKALAKFCDNKIELFTNYIDNQFDFSVKIEGFGEKRNQSIYDWFNNENNRKIYDRLLSILIFKSEIETNQNYITNNKLNGKTFVITGTVQHFKNRDELKDKLLSLGAKVSGSVSTKTTALINNDISSVSGKNKKAKELNIPIWSEEMLLNEIGE